ncbi:MAG: hypothetical protein C5B44_05450 [Acidobacteria bacterium]|nr:MAG: hypothetical protein C5B44_05450 [Acidobacteriota bacterium]
MLINHRVKIFACLASIFLAYPVQGSESTGPEPPGPKASPAVQALLDDAVHAADAQHPSDSLKSADLALEIARKTNDSPGEAFAQQARGRLLHQLKRTDEAIAAWQRAADIWANAAYVPERISALVQAGILIPLERKTDAKNLFAVGLSTSQSETQRPLALAQALHDCAVALVTGDRYYEQFSLDYLGSALALWEKLRPESLEIIRTLDMLGKLSLAKALRENNDPLAAKARDYFARASDIGRRAAQGSSILVESLIRLADSEYEISVKDRNSNAHYEEALRIQEQIAPDGSMEEVNILRGLSVDEILQGDLASAHQHLDRGVALAERLSPASGDFEHILEIWAEVHEDEGDLISARAIMERALRLRQKLPNPDIAPTYINLAALAMLQADYPTARAYFEKAYSLDANATQVIAVIPVALAGLSQVSLDEGDLTSALEYCRRALTYDRDKIGEWLGTANHLNLMGDILLAQGDYAAANDYYHQALQMRRKLSPESLDVVDSLSSLAKLAREQGKLQDAKQYDLEALSLKRKICPDFRCTAEILNDLGQLAYLQGNLKDAEEYFQEATGMREKGLGSMHPELARSLKDLALADASLGKTSEALDVSLRAEKIGAEHLRVSIQSLPERQALAYEAVRASGLDVALSVVAETLSAPSARAQVFDAVVRSRALVLDELATRHRSAYGSGDPEVTRIADQLASARSQLATLVFRGAGELSPETYRNLLDDASRRKEKAEQLLADKSIVFRQHQVRTQLGLKDVGASLPEHSALVSYVRYSRYQLKDLKSTLPSPPVASYAVFVLQAGRSEPDFVPLARADEIDRLVKSWRRGISREIEAAPLSTNGEDANRQAGLALRRMIWDPVAPRLAGASKVFIVPDAALHLVNFAALPSSKSQYLIETGPLIHFISTERDLVPAQSSTGEGILVVGNPAFDQAGRMVASNQSTTTTKAAAVPVLRSACGNFKSLHFTSLPASQQEVDRIAAVWNAWSVSQNHSDGTEQLARITGADASPEAFKQYAAGKRVLHLATHGFFLESDDCESAAQVASDPKRSNRPLPASAENPLLLSGLAFAGANKRTTTNQNEDDGILTAEEIAGLNLQGVEWAVLSACDTGVGEIRVGEGVLGLRRAFQVAGAKTVIMSLWPIEDETARHWMEILYREHFLRRKSTAEAVRLASLQALRERRAKHQSTHPFYWAAFIAAGSWQ